MHNLIKSGLSYYNSNSCLDCTGPKIIEGLFKKILEDCRIYFNKNKLDKLRKCVLEVDGKGIRFPLNTFCNEIFSRK